MMYKIVKLLMLTAACYFCPVMGIAQKPGSSKFKCMIQMTNYMGKGAYIVVSIVNEKDGYEKTLYVMGSDKKWYPNLKSWHKALAKKNENISAITGASVTGGDRSVTILEIDNARIDAGYKLRFETAVEDDKYHEKDLEMPLTTAGLSEKTDGTGYIRYVRFAPLN